MINRKYAIRCSIWLLIHGINFKTKYSAKKKRRKCKEKKGEKTLWTISLLNIWHCICSWIIFVLIIFIPICFAIFPSPWNITHRFSNGMHFHRTALYYHSLAMYFIFCFSLRKKRKFFKSNSFFSLAETHKKCAINEMFTLYSNYEHMQSAKSNSSVVLFSFMIHFFCHVCSDPQTLLHYTVSFGVNATESKKCAPPTAIQNSVGQTQKTKIVWCNFLLFNFWWQINAFDKISKIKCKRTLILSV